MIKNDSLITTGEMVTKYSLILLIAYECTNLLTGVGGIDIRRSADFCLQTRSVTPRYELMLAGAFKNKLTRGNDTQ